MTVCDGDDDDAVDTEEVHIPGHGCDNDDGDHDAAADDDGDVADDAHHDAVVGSVSLMRMILMMMVMVMVLMFLLLPL